MIGFLNEITDIASIVMKKQSESIKKIIKQGNKPLETYHEFLNKRIKKLCDIGEMQNGYEKDFEIQKIKNTLYLAGIIDENGNLDSKYRDND